MKTVQRVFVALFATVAGLWLWANAAGLAAAQGFFAWRGLAVQATGVLAIAAMSVAVVLAVRPGWLEHRLHGLDKMYRLHKWLGIAAGVLSVLHWLAAKGPKWLVQAGLLERPARGPRPVETDALLRFLAEQRGLAEEIGEKAFYVALVLIVLALLKRFPYRHFFRTHRWLALAYAALVLHTLVLLRPADWATPLGAVVAVLLLAGTVAAGVSALRRIGSQRQAVGEVERVGYLDGVKVNEIWVQLRSRWAGHQAGQFAFVTFDTREGAHPFTIASAWAGDGRLRFLVKALGDYTATLAGALRPGTGVTVEGPYGRFDFAGESRRQIWIGGGIGITPFVARMQTLARQPDGRTVDLFHTTREVDEEALARLRADAAAAGVRLHLLIDARDGRLDGARLRASVPDWRDADIWFCGPAGFGHALRDDLAAHGLPSARFHQELFEMR